MNKRFIVLSGALIVLAGCQNGVQKTAQSPVAQSPSAASQHRLTETQLRQEIGTKGLTEWGHTPNGSDFVVYLSPNGVIKTQSGSFSDVGHWSFAKDGQFCDQWHKIRGGAKTCFIEYRSGGKTDSVLPSGRVASVITRTTSGNPEHL